MPKTLADFKQYIDHGHFPTNKNYRPWIIRHLALARDHESTLDAMVAAYRDKPGPKLPVRTRFRNQPLRVLLDHGMISSASPDIYRLNAKLTPAEISELVSYCDNWLRSHP
ncbi:MAG: hypothetical protein SF187_12155 [Deltaproteobacteria bacterium]|nr:hypothetical protein [Deltaproteobacteria bacterium]